MYMYIYGKNERKARRKLKNIPHGKSYKSVRKISTIRNKELAKDTEK